jgi:hypothetical protein
MVQKNVRYAAAFVSAMLSLMSIQCLLALACTILWASPVTLTQPALSASGALGSNGPGITKQTDFGYKVATEWYIAIGIGRVRENLMGYAANNRPPAVSASEARAFGLPFPWIKYQFVQTTDGRISSMTGNWTTPWKFRNSTIIIPMRVIWRQALLSALSIGCLLMPIPTAFYIVKKRNRRLSYLCLKCGYPEDRTRSRRCPECGSEQSP